MPVTITTFRKDIFELATQALEGNDISFIHKGKLLKLVPAEKPSKLDRLTPMQIFNPDYVEPATSLQEEMEQAWEKKWANFFDRLS